MTTDETTSKATIHAALEEALNALVKCAKEPRRERREKIARDWQDKHQPLLDEMLNDVYESE